MRETSLRDGESMLIILQNKVCANNPNNVSEFLLMPKENAMNSGFKSVFYQVGRFKRPADFLSAASGGESFIERDKGNRRQVGRAVRG